MSRLVSLTQGEGVVDDKATEDLLHTAGMQETVSIDYDLKRFWQELDIRCDVWKDMAGLSFV